MVYFNVPFFPPSTNKAYFNRAGRRHLSDEGRAFKASVTNHLVRTYPREMSYFKKNKPYLIYLRLWMEKLENDGWPEKCKNRYKVFDSTNRIKLAEDAMRDAFGIDDSHHIAFLVHKCECRLITTERMEIFAWNLEEERSPLDAFTNL
jgi:hypothetical protein